MLSRNNKLNQQNLSCSRNKIALGHMLIIYFIQCKRTDLKPHFLRHLWFHKTEYILHFKRGAKNEITLGKTVSKKLFTQTAVFLSRRNPFFSAVYYIKLEHKHKTKIYSIHVFWDKQKHEFLITSSRIKKSSRKFYANYKNSVNTYEQCRWHGIWKQEINVKAKELW